MLSIVILAAGAGKRMKSTRPKVLHNVCGKSLITYTIDLALTLSKDIYVVLFNNAEEIKNHITSFYPSYLIDKIKFLYQHYNLYPGTGGALMDENKNLINFSNDRLLILNSDSILFQAHTLEKLIEIDGDLVLGVSKISNPFGYGRVIIDSKENIESIIEEKDCSEFEKQINTVNAGVYLFRKSELAKHITKLENNNNQKEYYITDIIKFIKFKTPFYFKEDDIFGINSKLDLNKVENIMLTRLRDKAMQEGVIMHNEKSIYLDYDVNFIGECELEGNVSIKGSSIIENSIIKSNTTILDSKISDSKIGPNAHIRPKSNIIKSTIGNFVECKNAILNGVKAGHLSYLGDCEINEGTNVGAGTITCNYDGKKKHKTIIGKNVFIGSDTQLIAPLTIEDNVIIAAGSTVTKNCKSGELIISRNPQCNKENGFYKFFKN